MLSNRQACSSLILPGFAYKKARGDYKKRGNDSHSGAAEEKGCPDVLLLLGLENRVVSQMSRLGILISYLNKCQIFPAVPRKPE